MFTAIRTNAFSFVWALNDLLYIPQTQSLTSWSCVFSLQLYSWWESFRYSSLVTLPLGFNCDFISTSGYGLSTGVYSWGFPGGLAFAPVRARCGGSAAAWVSGVLAAPDTQGSWGLGQQEIQCSRRVRQPVLAHMLQYFCLENPPPWQRSLAGHSSQGCNESDTTEATLCTEAQDFFLPMAALPQWELSVKVVQLLGLRGTWRRQVCRDMDCLQRRSFGPISLFSSLL